MPTADGGQTILGIGLILLSGASTVCLVILKSMFGQKEGNGKYMPRSECEAWRHGICDQLRTLTTGQAALFQKVDDIHSKMFRQQRDE